MDKIDVITARPVEKLAEAATEPNKPKKKQVEGKYLSSDSDFDELTVAAWKETTMKPFAAEYFKITGEDAETRKQLQKVDEWISKELESQGLEPTLKNYKELLKNLNMTKGIRTIDDFMSKLIDVGEPTVDNFGKKQSAFVTILKGLVNLMEEK